MARRALLSRIGGQSGAPVDEVQSILSHLEALLNTRQGDSPCVPRYGILDFADMVHGFPASIPHLLKSIRSTIIEFEPRLKNVSVRYQPEEGSLVLRFEIAAQLAQAKGTRTLRLATTVLPGGRIDITG
ncbi:MAG: type VI secretion system baseplate subunit TssE [Myxococcales bacterium]